MIKLIWLFISLFLIQLSTIAQINIYNHSLTDTTVPVVYKHVDNYLKISGVKGIGLKIVSTSSEIKLSHNELYNYKLINKLGQLDTVTILIDNKKVFSKIFKIDTITSPKAQLGNIIEGTVPKAAIIPQRQLKITLGKNYYKHHLYIGSYEATIYNSNGEIIESSIVSGYFIPAKIADAFLKLKSGDVVLFSNIIGMCSSGSSYLLENLRIVVK